MGMILLCFVAVVGAGPGELGAEVAAFARANLGRKVGDGECSALAAEALRHAGARRPGGGSWGDPVTNLRDARPGDILQFEDATFVQRRARPDGVVTKRTYRTPRHTAIVAETAGRGRDFRMLLLHQNAGMRGDDEAEKKVVQEWTLRPVELKSGTIRVFRPVAEGVRKSNSAARTRRRMMVRINRVGHASCVCLHRGTSRPKRGHDCHVP